MPLEHLAQLWELCFGDTEDTALEFLSIPDVITLTEERDERSIAMASLVPVSTECGQNGVYVYGVCVHPKHRGQGIFRELMARCEAFAKDKDADFLCLIPADDGVRNAYKKMGYDIEVATPQNRESVSVGIFSLSEDFTKFAVPDGEPSSNIKYGLLKPLEHFDAQNKKYSFLHHMGEC